VRKALDHGVIVTQQFLGCNAGLRVVLDIGVNGESWAL
jgi:hypothetical protein